MTKSTPIEIGVRSLRPNGVVIYDICICAPSACLRRKAGEGGEVTNQIHRVKRDHSVWCGEKGKREEGKRRTNEVGSFTRPSSSLFPSFSLIPALRAP